MAEDGKESNDGGEKSSKTESDKVAEIEAKQLEDDKIVDYDIPAFEDSKPVGKYPWVRFSFFFLVIGTLLAC